MGALTSMIADGKVQPVGWPAGDPLTSEAFHLRPLFTHSEVAAGAQVCVGYKTADDLFLGDDPIGQTVWINRKPCGGDGDRRSWRRWTSRSTRSKPNETFYLPVSTGGAKPLENDPWVEITARKPMRRTKPRPRLWRICGCGMAHRARERRSA